MNGLPSELDLPALLHVGIVVLDLEEAAANFARRWGARVTDFAEVRLDSALYHGRPVTISFRRGLISSGASQIELTQPLSESPFMDFLKERRGDGVHHLAYEVDQIDAYLERLNPTCAELVLDARLLPDGSRVVFVDGFAHGPSIELIQTNPGARVDETEARGVGRCVLDRARCGIQVSVPETHAGWPS